MLEVLDEDENQIGHLLKIGDELMQVNEQSTKGLSKAQVQNVIQGVSGTTVTLKFAYSLVVLRHSAESPKKQQNLKMGDNSSSFMEIELC